MRPLAAVSLEPSWDHGDSEARPRSGPRATTFPELYQQHFDFVWRVLRGYGVAPALLEDAAQDVFVVVHRRLPDFKPNATHRTWIFGIAVRVAKDYRRRAQRKGGLVPLEDDLADPTGGDPFHAAARGQAIRMIDAYLETLDEPRRDVFILSELEQMTAPEIAATLNTNLNTVYSRIRSVRKAFAESVARATEPHAAEPRERELSSQEGDPHG